MVPIGKERHRGRSGPNWKGAVEGSKWSHKFPRILGWAGPRPRLICRAQNSVWAVAVWVAVWIALWIKYTVGLDIRAQKTSICGFP